MSTVASSFRPSRMRPRRGSLADRLMRLPRYDQLALLALVLMVVVAIAAPLISPYGPYAPSGPPFHPPSSTHWFGTDDAGRDVFSRCLYGLRYSLIGAAVVIASGVVIGGAIGVAAGVAGGWLDTLLMRITDVFLALPAPLLAIAVAAALTPSFAHTLIAVSIVWWPLYARVIRGETKAICARPHMEAARLSGISPARRLTRHVLPGLTPGTVVLASFDVGGLIVTLASLSFLGLGAPAPKPELGAMAGQGLQYLLSAWWIAIFPAVSVLVVALIANLAGDALRDAVAE
jgi:peptide/nickel transport system permease protein